MTASAGKRRIYFIICSLLFTVPCLVSSLWFVSVAMAQGSRNHAKPMATSIEVQGFPQKDLTPGPLGNPPPVPLTAGNHQGNSQHLQTSDNGVSNSVLIGSHQGNSGNQGDNHGFSQDNSSNRGNAISSQRKAIGVQENRQFLQGDNSGGTDNATSIGFDQGNSGNQGVNSGFNQDTSGNSGNQVNNQGTIIGTQINQQGSDVNNDGSVIQHQINYVGLLPSIQLGVTLLPRPRLALKIN